MRSGCSNEDEEVERRREGRGPCQCLCLCLGRSISGMADRDRHLEHPQSSLAADDDDDVDDGCYYGSPLSRPFCNMRALPLKSVMEGNDFIANLTDIRCANFYSSLKRRNRFFFVTKFVRQYIYEPRRTSFKSGFYRPSFLPSPSLDPRFAGGGR